MVEAHPDTVGDSQDVQFCFDLRTNICRWSTMGKVTHCGDFYVYYLPDTTHCRLRYCAENWLLLLYLKLFFKNI